MSARQYSELGTEYLGDITGRKQLSAEEIEDIYARGESGRTTPRAFSALGVIRAKREALRLSRGGRPVSRPMPSRPSGARGRIRRGRPIPMRSRGRRAPPMRPSMFERQEETFEEQEPEEIEDVGGEFDDAEYDQQETDYDEINDAL